MLVYYWQPFPKLVQIVMTNKQKEMLKSMPDPLLWCSGHLSHKGQPHVNLWSFSYHQHLAQSSTFPREKIDSDKIVSEFMVTHISPTLVIFTSRSAVNSTRNLLERSDSQSYCVQQERLGCSVIEFHIAYGLPGPLCKVLSSCIVHEIWQQFFEKWGL